MPKDSALALNEIRNIILKFENLIFKSARPVKLRKIMPDSYGYDCKYDDRIRKADGIYICLLNELMLIYGRNSRCWEVMNEIEAKLTSSELYRDMIFEGRFIPLEKYLSDLKYHASEEIKFLEKSLTSEDYKSSLSSMPKNKLPLTKEKYFKELKEHFAQLP